MQDVGIIDGGVVDLKGNSRIRTYIVVPDDDTETPTSLLPTQNRLDHASGIEMRGDVEASGGSIGLSNYMMSHDGTSIVSDAKTKGSSSGTFMKGITAFLRQPFSDRSKIEDLPIKYAEVYNAMTLGIEDEQDMSIVSSSGPKKRERANGTKANGSKQKALSQGVPRSEAKQNWSSMGSLFGNSTADQQEFFKSKQKLGEPSRKGRSFARNSDAGSSKGVRSWSPESVTHSIHVLGQAKLGGNKSNDGLSSLRFSNNSSSSLTRVQQLLKASEIQWEFADDGSDSGLVTDDSGPVPTPVEQRFPFKHGSGLRLEAMIVEDCENDAGSDDEMVDSGADEEDGHPEGPPVPNSDSWRSKQLSGDPTSELEGSEEGSQSRSRSSTTLDIKRDLAEDRSEDANTQSVKDILLGF